MIITGQEYYDFRMILLVTEAFIDGAERPHVHGVRYRELLSHGNEATC